MASWQLGAGARAVQPGVVGANQPEPAGAHRRSDLAAATLFDDPYQVQLSPPDFSASSPFPRLPRFPPPITSAA